MKKSIILLFCMILVLCGCQNYDFSIRIKDLYVVSYTGGHNRDISFLIDNYIYDPVVIGCTNKYKSNDEYIIAQVDIYNDNIETAKKNIDYPTSEYINEILNLNASENDDEILKTYWVILDIDTRKFDYYYNEKCLSDKIEELNINLPDEWIFVE